VVQGLPQMNVGLYVALGRDGRSIRYVGMVRRPDRLNALAMRMEEHHVDGDMNQWGEWLWHIPLRVDLTVADVQDAEAALIDVLDPAENRTHRRHRGRGGWINRGLDARVSVRRASADPPGDGGGRR